MKVTAIINDKLVDKVISLSKGKNITEGIVIALEDYVYRKKIEKVIGSLDNKPVEFNEGFSAKFVREINRIARV